MSRKRNDAGFTLIELMIVVAIIGILAGIAVYMYSKSASKSKIQTEVTAMFAEFEQRMSQSQLEDGKYPVLADETNFHPTSPALGTKTANSLASPPAYWTDLRMSPSMSSVFCSYVVVTGEGGDSTNLGTVIQSMGLTTAPGVEWYYVLAKCDADGDGSDYSYFAMASDQTDIVKMDVGQ